MEYGLENFHRVNLLGENILYLENELPTLSVTDGQGEEIGSLCSVALRIPGREELSEDRGILLGDQEKIQVKIALKNELTAPVAEGEKVGEIRYVVGDEVYRKEDIVTAGSVEKIDLKWCAKKVLELFLNGEGILSFLV